MKDNTTAIRRTT